MRGGGRENPERKEKPRENHTPVARQNGVTPVPKETKETNPPWEMLSFFLFCPDGYCLLVQSGIRRYCPGTRTHLCFRIGYVCSPFSGAPIVAAVDAVSRSGHVFCSEPAAAAVREFCRGSLLFASSRLEGFIVHVYICIHIYIYIWCVLGSIPVLFTPVSFLSQCTPTHAQTNKQPTNQPIKH